MKKVNRSPLISVVIPIHNAEGTIGKCISSVLAQIYTNYELLLIDDGCKDGSGQICDNYALQDKRIKVVHKENGGVSSARNVGLDLAQGIWIVFIDADDWLEPDAFQYFVEVIQNKKIDYLLCGHYLNDIAKPKEGGDMSVRECLDRYDCDMLWEALYRRSIIEENHIRFNEEITLAEDRLFNYQYLRKCNRVYVSGHIFYHYNFGNEDSLSHKGFNIENWSKCQLLIYKELKVIHKEKAIIGFINTFKGTIWARICAGQSLNELVQFYDYVHQEEISLPKSYILRNKVVFYCYCIIQKIKFRVNKIGD